MSPLESRAQQLAAWLLGDVEHVAKLNAKAWKVGNLAHHALKSSQIILHKGQKRVLVKPFHRVISGPFVLKDEGAVVFIDATSILIIA